MKKGKAKQSVSILGQGNRCPKCNEIMQRRGHKYLTEKQQHAPYHFSEWDVCINYKCRHMQHYDEYKVYHNNDMSMYVKLKEEESNLLDLMRTF